MSKKRVLVAMSGGVDSSVAAALLLEQGYEVEGATMQIWPDVTDEEERITRGCCSLSAVDDARRVAMTLGIKYHVLNFKDVFEKNVISPFVQEYIHGRTPNPCIECNKIVKFQAFLQKALMLDFDFIATGHYGRICYDENSGRWLLNRSVTAAKDQTYALYNLTQDQLSRLLLPIGNMEKPQVRQYAKDHNIPVFDKPDSQEICFVRDNDYAGFISARGYTSKNGNFIDTNGNVIGTHNGIYHYTIGQRKGLGAFGRPVFVTKINPETNEVTLGDNEDTLQNELTAHEMNWIAVDNPQNEFKCMVKIRYNGPAASAVVYPNKDGVRVVFDSPARAVTPGQSVVMYTDTGSVIGGGKIN